MNSNSELAIPPEEDHAIKELRRNALAAQEKAAKAWEEKRIAMTRQTQEARRGLVEEEARRRAFRHLDEVNMRRPEDCADILDEVVEQYLNGRFFLREIGLFYEVNPHLAMTVFQLRQVWIEQYNLKTVPELMLLDQAMLAYFHMLRTNKEIAKLFSLLEDVMFLRNLKAMRDLRADPVRIDIGQAG